MLVLLVASDVRESQESTFLRLERVSRKYLRC